MDQRRYWRRTGHRVGEPGVQRDLRALPGATDAKDVDQHSHAGDDQDHHHRQLIELECGVDVEITDGHPLEVALDERSVSLGVAASALHREEDDGGEPEREHHDAGPNYTR